jgi:hypothetical protein
MKAKTIFGFLFRLLVLSILYGILFIAGSMFVSGMLPKSQSEPGLVSPETGLLLVSIISALVIMLLILSSRWSGWKLAFLLAFAWYGAMTLIMQIETWYFLSAITVDAKLLPRLFLMGLPVAFVFVPLAVWIMGKRRSRPDEPAVVNLKMPVKQWLWKLGIIAITYVILYWCAGYFIAWQNPALRSFYGSPGDILPFWQHTANTLKTDPGLLPFQVMRAMLWTLFALPVIAGSKLDVWKTALLVGIFLSLPQNLGHIVENPLIPIASVRLSHFIETASSTFLFGVIMTLVLHWQPKRVVVVAN